MYDNYTDEGAKLPFPDIVKSIAFSVAFRCL